VEPVHLIPGLAVAEAEAETGRPAHFVDVQNLLNDSLKIKSKQFIFINSFSMAHFQKR